MRGEPQGGGGLYIIVLGVCRFSGPRDGAFCIVCRFLFSAGLLARLLILACTRPGDLGGCQATHLSSLSDLVLYIYTRLVCLLVLLLY
ncbi:hypothetical protein B0I37DRAFT_367884, partial [Chaetomium sp. MPI-CAGE-AT-0009]